MRPEGVPVTIGGKEYKLYFTLNAIDKIQTEYGRSISDLADILGNSVTGIGAQRFVLTALVNEGLDYAADDTGIKSPHIAEDYVGRHVLDNMRPKDILQAIYAAFVAHNQSETDDPNPESE